MAKHNRSLRGARLRSLDLCLALGLGLSLAACGGKSGEGASISPDAATESAATAEPALPFDAESHARDRAAILAMAGEYEVTFQFEETVAHRANYELTKPYEAKATELVQVVADEPNFISLQHILVVVPKPKEVAEGSAEPGAEVGKPMVIKHWRQDWRFEDAQLFEFKGHDVWQQRELSATEAHGTWTQSVYQVDDGPRYEGYGEWVHIGDASYWESNETWRPLPRREYTKRKDYHVIIARNRHAITRDGWTHEQDNHKVALDGAGQPVELVARESGHNVYHKATKPELSAAVEYWTKTKDYWAVVRTAWDEIFAAQGPLEIVPKASGKARYRELFKRAEAPETPATAEEIKTMLLPFVRSPASGAPASS